jgi:hypothetical protein
MRRIGFVLLLTFVVIGSSFTLSFAQEGGGIFAKEDFSSTLAFTSEYV